MMTQKRVQELADKLDIPVSFKYNDDTSRTETTIRGNHFPRLPDAHIYLVGVEVTNKEKAKKKAGLPGPKDLLELVKQELGECYIEQPSMSVVDFIIKPHKDSLSEIKVIHYNKSDCITIKDYSIQRTVYAANKGGQWDNRNYMGAVRKRTLKTILDTIKSDFEYISGDTWM